MSANNQISHIIESQFPSFIRSDGPNLVAFVKAYYEWAEQTGRFVRESQSLLENFDIDTADVDPYFDFIKRELIPSIPENIIIDKRLLAKHIKDFYRSKGSEYSYALLFKIIYGEDIDFYYPGEDILRWSDGRWIQENSIRVLKISGEPGDLYGKIIGQTSGANAIISNIVRTEENGRIVYELFLENINLYGQFINGEIISNIEGNIIAEISSRVGPGTNLTINKGGALHQINDDVIFISGLGSGGTGTISETSDTSAFGIEIIDGGTGYSVSTPTSLIGGSGSEASFSISAIDNAALFEWNIDPIEPMAAVPINTGPTFTSTGANTATINASLAAADVSTAMSTAFTNDSDILGTISELTINDYGYGYKTLPVASVINAAITEFNVPFFDENQNFVGFYGGNANLLETNSLGAIVSINVTNAGISYEDTEIVEIVNTTRTATQSAFGLFNIQGILSYPGRYVDTKGWFSWNNKLQDNYYYQEFSYSIRSESLINEYRNIVKNILHPAGTQLFGNKLISSVVDVNNTYTTSNNASFTLGTGTLSVANGDVAVTGIGTAFLTEALNNTLLIGDSVYSVNSVSTDTSLVLGRSYDYGIVTNSNFYYK